VRQHPRAIAIDARPPARAAKRRWVVEQDKEGVFDPTGARSEACARVSSYLQREAHIPSEEADRRGRELVGLIAGPGVAGWLAASGANALIGNWWLFLLRGVLALIFGVLTLVQPLAALVALVLVFGVWAFIDGISALTLAISGWRSWQLVVVGLIGIAVGLFTFFRPGLTAVGLYAAVAAWSIARGILEIAVAIELRRTIKGEVWLVLGGIFSILFGVLMILLPVAGLLALAWLIGAYALIFGGIMCVLAYRLHRLLPPGHRRERVSGPAPTATAQAT
jgi:uncharacterized membrane protein HdeD (DUF308 family)